MYYCHSISYFIVVISTNIHVEVINVKKMKDSNGKKMFIVIQYHETLYTDNSDFRYYGYVSQPTPKNFIQMGKK